MSRGSKKQQLIAELGEQFRISGIQDIAFDDATADRLGINRTDLNCIYIIERHGAITAGALAAEAGLTTGAVTAVIDRLDRDRGRNDRPQSRCRSLRREKCRAAP